MLDFNRIQLVVLCVFLSVFSGFAQQDDHIYTRIASNKIITTQSPILRKQFKHWETYKIDIHTLFAQAKNNPTPAINLNLGTHHLQAQLQPVPLLGENYRLRTQDGSILTQHALPFRANLKNGETYLTINKDFLYGYFTQGQQTWYIEPLWYFIKDAPKDEFIVYNALDFIDDGVHTCGVTETKSHKNKPLATPEDIQTNCYQVKMAIASDYLMYIKYNSNTSDVENHNIGVINNVQGNYAGTFNDDLILTIVTQYVSTSSSEPWTNSTNPDNLLPSFRDWGNNNGFGISDYNVGELWSDRDFDGSTIGLAYIGVVCGAWDYHYHILQDFSTNAEYLRVLTAHEMGHNFDASHDATDGFIMAPSVSAAQNWSAQSLNEINNFIAPIVGSCLVATSCTGGAADVPVVNFSVTPSTICAGEQVQYHDLSSNNPTSWSWTFPGGTPSTSTEQNPFVTYNTGGTYDATLEASNASGSSGPGTIQNIVHVADALNVGFTFSANGLHVDFTNTTTDPADVISYSWDFGDPGSGAANTSTLTNPSHDYPVDGAYTIVLTAEGTCGTYSYSYALSVNTPAVANFTASPQTVCGQDTVYFTSTSSANTTQWTWSFPGGNPSSSNLENPKVVYSNPGNYDVTLVAASTGGPDTETKFSFISVLATPSAAFTASTPSGMTVNFTNNTTPTSGTSYSWDFGDSNSSTDVNPSHTYANPGTYTVVLTATNNSTGCTSTATQTIQIQNPPVANFSADPLSGCAPLTVNFTDQSTNNPASWQWSFPGGSPASSFDQTPPTVTYSNPGQYTVTLFVANASGTDTMTITNMITVGTAPTASFTQNTNGNQVSFTNTSTNNPTNYSWDFGDGSPASTETSPTHTYTTDGTYTVTLTATNGCGSNPTQMTVTISGNTPTASISVSPSNTVCTGSTITFTANVSANTQNVAWTFEGGNPATSTNMTQAVTFDTPGTYAVSLTAYNGANSASANTTITILPNTTSDFATGTSGLTANFTNTSTNGNSYSWDFGDGNFSTEFEPSHTYLADGTYHVCLTVNGTCNSPVNCHDVTISGNGPSVSITASQTSICQGQSISYHANASSNTQSVQWTFQGGSPSSSTNIDQVVTYNQPGTYLTTLMGSNPSGNSTDNVQIIVLPNPTAEFTTNNISGATATFTNASTGNPTSYSWDFGDSSPNSTDVNPTHEFPGPGTYTVCLTATNSCTPSTTCHNVVISNFMPTANIQYTGSATGCEPFQVNFTADVTNQTTVFWTFEGGDPATSNLLHQTVTFSTPGTHTVTLSATNTYGTANATPQTMTVNPLPIADFDINVDGYLVTTTNNSQNGSTYAWDFGDGSPILTSPNPAHLYASDTVAVVQLITTNGCGSDTTTNQVTIGAVPSADPTASAESGCGPFTTTFHANAQNANSYQWSFPGGTPATSTDPNPTVTYNTVGQHTATVIVSNNLGQDLKTITVTVLPETTSGFTYTIDPNDDHKVLFTSSAQNANTLLWDFGDNNTAPNVTNIEHTFSDGTYTIKLTANGDCGGDVFEVELTFGSTTAPTVSMSSSDTEGCSPLEVVFTAQVSNADNFSWSFPGGNPATSTDTTVTVTYTVAGSYTAKLTATNDYGSPEVTQTVIVHPLVIADYEFGDLDNQTLELVNHSENATGYLWNFGDGQTSMEESPTHTFTNPGNYNILLTAFNSCDTATISRSLYIKAPDGITDPDGEVSIMIAPNPSDGIFTLNIHALKAEEMDMTIYDVIGRKLIHRHWGKTATIREEINMDEYPSGNYIFQLRYRDRLINGKLVKVKM